MLATESRLSGIAWFDVVIALGLMALSLLWDEEVGPDFRAVDAYAVLLIIVQTLPLAVRRRYPASTVAVIGVAFIIDRMANYPAGPATYGALLALHAVGSNVIIIVLLLHMLSVLFMGSYKRPRELTWLSGFWPKLKRQICMAGLVSASLCGKNSSPPWMLSRPLGQPRRE